MEVSLIHGVYIERLYCIYTLSVTVIATGAVETARRSGREKQVSSIPTTENSRYEKSSEQGAGELSLTHLLLFSLSNLRSLYIFSRSTL